MPKREATFRKPDFDPNKVIQYKHDPWNRSFGKKVRAACSENGKVTLTVEAPDGDYDEVVVSASVIYKIAFMLDETRGTSMVNKEDLEVDP